jgi:hypothetical protein
MKEFKVIKGTHQYSKLDKKVCYAIVSSTYMVAECDAKRGVYVDNEEDMYIIAKDIADADKMLVGKIYDA